MDLTKLKDVFNPDDIEWRVSRAGESGGKAWAFVLAYVTNRAIMNRLDDVCAPENWKNEFAPAPNGGTLCGISIKINNEWVTKWDGSDNTNIEAVKGGLSGAMKRSAVQWGIGRYLYDLPETYAVIDERGEHYQGADPKGKYKAFKWNPPQLPEWALPLGFTYGKKTVTPPTKTEPTKSESVDKAITSAERTDLLKETGDKITAANFDDDTKKMLEKMYYAVKTLSGVKKFKAEVERLISVKRIMVDDLSDTVNFDDDDIPFGLSDGGMPIV